jgi:bacillithiol biosynthesis cysteine-adding enzyme BshC
MTVSIERLPLKGPAICAAYIDAYSSVSSFYNAGPPTQLESYRRVADRVRESEPAARWAALADGLHPADPEVAARLDRLVQGRGVFVATGQQAGLFVSPLLTLYKAMTAARLAQQLEESLGIPVMALFSTASEDHDWNEVNHTHVVDLQNQLVRISVQGPGGDSSATSPPVERIEVGPHVEQALAELDQATPDSEFKASILAPLRDAYRPGRGFAEAFESALGQLLQAHSFLLVRTAHPHVKRASRDLLWSEWARRQESEARLLERVERLEAAGFEAQVPVSRGATNLFLDGSLGRDRLVQDGAGARLRRSREPLSEAELREILDNTPGRISPGVLLRPVSEARAFPVVAHVGGSSEIAYLAQSQVLFDLHGVPAPVVVPRASFQLVEPKVARVLQKYDLDAQALAGDAAATISRLLKQRTPPELQESLAALRESVSAALEQVESAAIDFDPGAKSAMGSGKRVVFEAIKTLEAKLQTRVKEKNQTMAQQLQKAAVNLYPGGRPQERVLNPYPYLIRYGPSLLEQIYARVATPLE